MGREELSFIIDHIIPKVYDFAYVIAGDELAAEQLVVDAYTVFIIENKDFLSKEDLDLDNKSHRKSFQKYLYRELVREVYDLTLKRAHLLSANNQELGSEFENFYNLSMFKRGLLYLKEIVGFTVSDLQEVFVLDRYQVIEAFYNAKHEVLDSTTSSSLEQVWK